MRGVYWGLILLVLPAFIRLVPGGDLRFAKDGLFLWSALLGTGMFGVRAFKGGALVALCTIGVLTFFNQYHPYSAAVYHQSLMVMAGWVILAQAMLLDDWDWDNVHKFLSISIVVQAIWIISNSFGTDPWNWIGLRRNWSTGEPMGGTQTIIGILHNPSISAPFLAAMAPFALTSRYKWGLVPLALYGVYLCNSTMAWAGIFMAVLWWVWRQRGGRKLVVAISAASAIALWAVRDSRFASSSGRTPAWETWFQHIQSRGVWHNLFGNGVGYVHDQFRNFYRGEEGQVFLQLHSEPMEVHAAWGLVGLICAAYLLYRIRDRGSVWFYSFLILWVNSIGNLTFHISATTLLMILCYAKITSSPCKE